MESVLTVIVQTVSTQGLLPEWSTQDAVGTNLLSVNSLTWNQKQNFLLLLTQKTSDGSEKKNVRSSLSLVKTGRAGSTAEVKGQRFKV